MPESSTGPVARSSYDIFLSYSHADSAAAGRVSSALREVGLSVFDASQSAEFWGSDFSSFLSSVYPERTHAAMVLLSQAYAESSWCTRELDLLALRAAEFPDAGFILPVRLDDAPVPTSIAHLLYLDFRNTEAGELANLAKKRLDEWKQEQHEVLARLTDEELMQRVTALRDSEAFGVLYERLYPFIRRYAAHLASEADADDLALEVMIKIWMKAGSFDRNRGPLQRWLYALCRNTAVDYMRHQVMQAPPHTLARNSLELSTELMSPSAEMLNQLNEAVATLSEPERQIIAALCTGVPVSEIARQLNVPTTSVSIRLRRILWKLRKTLGGVLQTE